MHGKDSEFVEIGDTGMTLENGNLKGAKCPCSKHPYYKAYRRPTSECPECWDFYFRMNPEAVEKKP